MEFPIIEGLNTPLSYGWKRGAHRCRRFSSPRWLQSQQCYFIRHSSEIAALRLSLLPACSDITTAWRLVLQRPIQMRTSPFGQHKNLSYESNHLQHSQFIFFQRVQTGPTGLGGEPGSGQLQAWQKPALFDCATRVPFDGTSILANRRIHDAVLLTLMRANRCRVMHGAHSVGFSASFCHPYYLGRILTGRN